MLSGGGGGGPQGQTDLTLQVRSSLRVVMMETRVARADVELPEQTAKYKKPLLPLVEALFCSLVETAESRTLRSHNFLKLLTERRALPLWIVG